MNSLKTAIALLLLAILSAFTIINTEDKSLNGAWTWKNGTTEEVLLFTDGYFVHTAYDKSSKKFLSTRGGQYGLNNGQLSVQYEFDTQNAAQVGKAISYSLSLNDELSVTMEGNKKNWKRLDNNAAPLAGVWHITERMQDGKLVPIHRTGTRKTLKILTGKRFQWAAIDPGKKEFSGTGGGTYSFENGSYTENIEFFSRDSNRVGVSLRFDGKLENGKWHHSGLSSRGDKIYEVWSRVNTGGN